MATHTNDVNRRPVLGAFIATGIAGAVVGGSGAAARTLIQAGKGHVKKDRAVKYVLSESAGTGFATASAGAVVSALGMGTSLIGLSCFTGVTVGAKYIWDTYTGSEPLAAEISENRFCSDKSDDESEKTADVSEDTGDDVSEDTGDEKEKRTQSRQDNV